MGRSRKRQRREVQQRPDDAAPAGSTPILTPTYLPVRPDAGRPEPCVDAPVLELDGLEPWAEIPGPALALEDEPETDESLGVTFASPDQLELEPWKAGPSANGDAAAEPQAVGPPPPAAAAGHLATTPPAAEEPGPEAEPASAEPLAAAPQPDPSDLLYASARAAAHEGHPGAAKALYRELLSRYPRHLRARNNLALLLDASGDHAGALAELDRALEMDAEHTTLLTNRGALLGALGRYAAAERDLRRVLRVEPSNVEALFNLGVVMSKKGLWSEAVPPLRRVTELDPDRSPAFYYLGEALNHVDDLQGALSAYQRATELQPTNARALYGLGIIYDRLARPDDAALMYRKSREVARR
jgi:Flp pilus assembly protein TadD